MKRAKVFRPAAKVEDKKRRGQKCKSDNHDNFRIS